MKLSESDKTKSSVLIGFSVLILMGLALSVFSIYQLQNFKNSMSSIVQVSNQKVEYAYGMRDAIHLRAIALRNMAATNDIFERDAERLKFNIYATRYAVARSKLLDIEMTDIEEALHQSINNRVSAAYPVNQKAANLLIYSQDKEAMNLAITDAFTAQQLVIDDLEKLVNLQKEYSKLSVEKANNVFDETLSVLFIFGLLAILISFLVVRKISCYVTEKNQELMSATNTKSMFLANMSHEIRTPLTAIIGFAKTLMDKKLSVQRKEKATSTIIRNGEHLLDVINSILDLSKIEANKLDIEKYTFSIHKVFSDVQNILQSTSAEKGIGLKFNYSFPLPDIIVSDPVRVKQIILNLCSNAIKFTAAGYVHVNVSYDRVSHVLITHINDTGIGMSEEQQQKVFDSFSQADISTTRKFGGTGLGLPISKQLSEILGGDISVTSKLNEGSCFTFNLNLDADFEPTLVYEFDEENLNQVSKSSELYVDNSVRGNILLVEDMPDNQDLISFLLEDMGANVVTVCNGKEAVEITEKNEFDLIFMDMQMPVMGGVEAVKNIRQRGYSKPIVMLSANAMQKERDTSFTAGCDDFLTKPIDEVELYNCVKSYLDENDSEKNNGEDNKQKNNSNPVEVANDEKDFGEEVIISTLIKKNAEKYTKRINKFLGRMPILLSEIVEAHEKNDIESVRAKAHDLRGVGGNFGFQMITDISAELEDEILSSCEQEKINQYMTELKIVFEKIIKGGEMYNAQYG